MTVVVEVKVLDEIVNGTIRIELKGYLEFWRWPS